MFRRKIKNRISIVQKVIYHSLTGQRLGLITHNLLNSRIHSCWSTEIGTFKYKDCIEVVREKDWLRFCKELKISGVAGLAACLVRGITYDGYHRAEPFIFLEKAIWGNRTVWKNYCWQYLKVRNVCLCPVSSSSVIS